MYVNVYKALATVYLTASFKKRNTVENNKIKIDLNNFVNLASA